MGLCTREGEGGESGDLGERRRSSAGEGERPLYSGERSRGDLEAGERGSSLLGDLSLSPTIESIEKPSLPLAWEAVRRLWDDLAVRVAERMECGDLMVRLGACEWGLGNSDMLTTVIAS